MKSTSVLWCCAILLLVPLAASCSIKETIQPETIPGSTVLTATVEDDCKTYLEGGPVKWEDGDCICVLTKGSKNCGSYVLSSGAGTEKATFTGGDLAESSEYYALYPYGSSYSKTEGKYRFTTSSVQKYKANSFGTKSNPMIATFASAADNLSFKNVYGLLKLQFKGSALVKKIVVADADDSTMLYGKVALTLDGKQGTDGQTLSVTEGGNAVTLDCSDGVRLTTSVTPFFLALPPGTLSKGFSVQVYGNDDILLDSFTTSKDNSIIRSQVRSMPVREIVADLSYGETANCYVVYNEGKYRFKAVQGNSSETLTDVNDAVLLWETKNLPSKPAVNSIISDVSYSDGYVTFSTTGEYGNAVIAARNSAGTILWSWHIWIPGTTVAALSRKGDYLMDRNLGAVYGGHPSGDGVLQIGLLYQWGRKDPFTSCSAGSTAGSTTVAASTADFTLSARTAPNGSVEYCVSHPMEYIYFNEGTKDWLTMQDDNLWAASKTKYDPCPPGYHVPSYTDWTGKTATFYADACFGADVDYYEQNSSWFPAGGYRYTSDGSTHAGGTYGCYWSYNVNGSNARVTRVGTGKSKIDNQSFGRSAGCSVRCIADSAPPSPVDPLVDEVSVCGTVTGNGNPLEGVCVSDGYNVVKTDASGYYEMVSKKKLGYVFISTPSGYEAPVQPGNTIAEFFKYTTQASGVLETIDFTLDAAASQTDFKLLALGDIQIVKRESGKDVDYFKHFAEELQEYVSSHSGETMYGVTVGDLSWNDFWYTKNFFLSDFKTTFNSAISGIKFYNAPGNHENDRGYGGTYPADEDASKTPYRKTIGPSWYSANIGQWHLVVLDNICCDVVGPPDSGSGNGKISYGLRVPEAQLRWLEKDLSALTADTPLIISMHAPIYKFGGSYALENAQALISAIGGRTAYVLSGHTHYILNTDKLSSEGIYELNTGSVCGSLWDTQYYCDGLGICKDGAASGFRVLDIKGKNISWEFLCTDKSPDYQFRVYDRNEICLTADKYIPNCTTESLQQLWAERTAAYSSVSTANEIIINVFDYDPSWTLEVLEGGNPLNVTYLGTNIPSVQRYDPLHLICMEAKYFDQNKSISSDSTTGSSHLFKCTASSATSTITVKVTSRFGKLYQQTINRPFAFTIENYISDGK